MGSRRPKQLPCGHSICGPCYNSWASKSSRCPECNTDVPCGILLKDNYLAIEQITKLHVDCVACKTAANKACTECFSTYCEECLPRHDCNFITEIVDLEAVGLQPLIVSRVNKILKNDEWFLTEANWTNISLLEIIRALLEGELRCRVHPLKSAKYYYKKKPTLYCADCVTEHDKFAPLVDPWTELLDDMHACLKVHDLDEIPPQLYDSLETTDPWMVFQLLARLKRSPKKFVAYCLICRIRLAGLQVIKYPCIGIHVICKDCFDRRDDKELCPFEKERHSIRMITRHQIQASNSQCKTSCPNCFELKAMKGLTCGHAYCEKCLRRLKRCIICRSFINRDSNFIDSGLKLVESDQLLCICKTQIASYFSVVAYDLYCASCAASQDSNTIAQIPQDFASFIEDKTLAYCSSFSEGSATSLEGSLIQIALRLEASKSLSSFAVRYKTSSLADRLTLFKLIDQEIEVNTIDEAPYTSWKIKSYASKLSVLRFSSLLPPAVSQDPRLMKKYYRIRRSNQVEIVGLHVSRDLQLQGVIFASCLEDQQGSLKQFEVLEAAALSDGLRGSYYDKVVLDDHSRTVLCDRHRLNLSLPETSKYYLLSSEVRLCPSHLYILKFKLGGAEKGVCFYKGNPREIHYEDLGDKGNDGTTFRFLKAIDRRSIESSRHEYVDKHVQNHITSVLLGLIYE